MHNSLHFLPKDDAAASYGFTGAESDPCAESQSSNGKNIGRRKKRNAPSAEQRANLAENLLRVDVYFETLSVQNITETPTYDVSIAI